MWRNLDVLRMMDVLKCQISPHLWQISGMESSGTPKRNPKLHVQNLKNTQNISEWREYEGKPCNHEVDVSWGWSWYPECSSLRGRGWVTPTSRKNLIPAVNYNFNEQNLFLFVQKIQQIIVKMIINNKRNKGITTDLIGARLLFVWATHQEYSSAKLTLNLNFKL